MTDLNLRCPAALLAGALLCSHAAAQDWPMWGRDATRNMVAGVKGLPLEIVPGQFAADSEDIDIKTSTNVKWIAKLGSQSYGNPTVADGRVYVGTNNDVPRDDRFQGDRSCVYCLDEQTGAMIWQLNIPKLGTGKVSDWEFLGICSSPAIEGDRVYLVTNRCEVMCVDVNGFKDGNQGFQDEAAYYADNGKPPVKVNEETDADIIWKMNMIDECGVFPHNITSCSVMIVGDQIWTSTSNGVDYGHVETPAPNAPSMVVVDKKTGALIGEEASGLSQNIFHSNWSSPAYLKTDEAELVIFGGPDGVLYAFDPKPTEDEDGFLVLNQAWKFDCNPKGYRVKEDGSPRKYATAKGPSEVLATPVVYNGRAYALVGQDPEHGEGVGNLVCVDSAGKQVWSYDKIHRSMSTLSIHDGLLFAADYSGYLHCLDADTGEEHWKYDTSAHIWGSTLVADGRVYVGIEDGFMVSAPATKTLDKNAVKEIDFGVPIYSSPIAANGVLYVATHTHLFAIAETKK
ncbi:MAG: PQQ-binding-like beta-propeller repeat protein [Planctomycetota bacterium]|nr:PQQ-binding-like beta-propeller repeat protein [Planctomycetota bacterium]